MATLLQIRLDTTLAYDLQASSRLRVVAGSRRTIYTADGRATETMQVIERAAAADIRNDAVDLEFVLNQASLWHDSPLRQNGYWLYEQTDGEAAKRAFLYDWLLSPVDGDVYSQNLEHGAALFDLALTRDARYETPENENFTATGVSLAGGLWDITLFNTAQAVHDHRIGVLKLTPSATIEQLWIGIRPDLGTGESHNLFDPLIEIESGSVNSADTDSSKVARSGASGSGNNAVQTTFAANPDMLLRAYVLAFPVTQMTHFKGRYTVLLRYQLSNGSTEVGARLGVSYKDPETKFGRVDWQQTEYLSGNTGWQLAEIGEVQLPPSGLRQGLVDLLDEYAVYLSLGLERISGSGSFYADAFLLIPADHQVLLSQGTATSAIPVYIVTYEDGTVEAYTIETSNGRITGRMETTARNWNWPRYGGVLVVAGQTDTAHSLTTTVNTAIDIYRSWRLYRTDEIT